MYSIEEIKNTIILGDSYKELKSIPSKSIDLVYIDIPYLYSGGGAGKSELSKRIAKVAFEDLAVLKDGINFEILDDLCRVMKKIYIYIWCSKSQIFPLLEYFLNKSCMFEILTWNKTNPTPMTNNVFLPDIEYCLLFRENGCKLNPGYELKSKWYISPINKVDKDKYKHPTIKPLELVKRHILHSTQPGDLVLDCFSGSGTTCLACKDTGRNYIGIEINPEYYKISQNRLNGILANGQMSLDTQI